METDHLDKTSTGSPGPPVADRTTILVVEDEPALRHMAAKILRSLGYHVLDACDGDAGLTVLASHSQRIDLVFSDVRMPRRNGPQFVHEARKLRTDFRVLFTSGCTFDSQRDLFDGFEEEQASCLLVKPYTPVELATRINEVIGLEGT